MKKNARVLFSDVNVHVIGTYSVIFITNDQSGNQSDTFKLHVAVELRNWGGLDEVQVNHMKLIPNPSNGQVRIQFNETVIGIYSSFYFIDARGYNCKPFDLRNAEGHQITLDLTDLPSGVYLLMGRTKDGFCTMLSRLVHY